MTDSRSVLDAVPGVALVRSYKAGWLRSDIVAGLILTALLVPQGMAYAELAGLPPITGLYTSIRCLVGYAVFGPSKVLVLGPDSALGPMIAACIIPLVAANGDPGKAVAYASILALMVGAITVLAGIFKLGFVASLLSKPTQIGYMNGLAVTIVIGQLPKLFGFSVDGDGLIDETAEFVRGVADGKTVPMALLIGVLSLALILVFQRLLPRVPGVLVAVVLAILAVNLFDLTASGVKVVGPLPEGFPPFTIPTVPVSDLLLLFAGAMGIALVSLTDTISTASAFAARSGAQVDGMAGYHDSRVNPTAAHLPGLVIYRFDGPLFFANANTFRDKVLELAGSQPRPTWILVAAEPITDVDTTAADMLEDLDLKLNESGTSLVFAEMKTPVRLKVERYELTGVIEQAHFFGTIEEAVQAYQDQTGAQWVTEADTPPPG